MLKTEADAALAEGLVQINDEQLKRLRRARQLKLRADEIEAELKQLRDEFRTELEADATTGLLYRGKKVVQVIPKVRRGVDSKLLASAFPEVLAAVRTETEYSEIRIA